MANITPEEVKKLFELARLPLDEAKLASYQKDLEEILGYVASLSRLNAADAPEIHGGADIMNAFRADALRAENAAERDAVVKAFPKSEADLNKVPPILGK